MARHFGKYLAVSVVALGVDYGLLLLITQAIDGYRATLAATTYIIGAVVHYFLSRKFVFPPGWLARYPKQEFLWFVLSGAVGTVITAATFQLMVSLGVTDVTLQKMAAVAVSFVVTYLLRKYAVFGKGLKS